MRSCKFALVATILALIASGLAAQAKDTPKELTVEQLFLRSVEFQVIREKAYDDDHDSKMSALDSLEQKLNAGDPAPEVEPVLEYLSLEGTGHRVRQDGKLINYFPDVRRRAAALLAKVNSDQAAYALMTVLLNDDESMVKAQAALSLGALTLKDNRVIIQALTYSVSREDHTRPDNSWAYAVLIAFEEQSKQPGGIKDQAAFQAILTLGTKGYSRTVKEKAFAVLAQMKG